MVRSRPDIVCGDLALTVLLRAAASRRVWRRLPRCGPRGAATATVEPCRDLDACAAGERAQRLALPTRPRPSPRERDAGGGLFLAAPTRTSTGTTTAPRRLPTLEGG